MKKILFDYYYLLFDYFSLSVRKTCSQRLWQFLFRKNWEARLELLFLWLFFTTFPYTKILTTRVSSFGVHRNLSIQRLYLGSMTIALKKKHHMFFWTESSLKIYLKKTLFSRTLMYSYTKNYRQLYPGPHFLWMNEEW